MLRLWLTLFLLLFALPSFAGNVFIIQSYHMEYEWDAEYIETLQTYMGPEHTYTIRSLDSKRQPAEVWQETAKTILIEIESARPDLVIVGDDNAMKSIAVPLNGSDIPVIFLGVNGTLEQYGVSDSNNITGILERPFFELTVRHLRKVLTERERFLVLMDDSVTMQNAIAGQIDASRTLRVQATDVDFVLTNDAQSWQQAILDAPDKYDAIILGTYHTLRSSDDEYFDPADAMAFALANTEIPIFSFWNIFIGQDKAIGGYAVTAYEEGKAAARMAQLILRGVKVSSVPPSVSLSGQYVYSQAGLERWGIQLTTLTKSQTLFVE